MSKLCPQCKLTLSFTDYYEDRRTPTGTSYFCKKCTSAKNKENYRKRLQQPVISIVEKTCNICRLVYPASGFYTNKGKSDGLDSQCKLCRKNQGKAWRLANIDSVIEKSRDKRLRHRYGVTEAEVDAQRDRNKNHCPICKKEYPKGKRPHTDHDHVTGKFRDVLCFNCNTGLGMFKDDPEIMQNAIAYILKHRESEA